MGAIEWLVPLSDQQWYQHTDRDPLALQLHSRQFLVANSWSGISTLVIFSLAKLLRPTSGYHRITRPFAGPRKPTVAERRPQFWARKLSPCFIREVTTLRLAHPSNRQSGDSINKQIRSCPGAPLQANSIADVADGAGNVPSDELSGSGCLTA